MTDLQILDSLVDQRMAKLESIIRQLVDVMERSDGKMEHDNNPTSDEEWDIALLAAKNELP